MPYFRSTFRRVILQAVGFVLLLLSVNLFLCGAPRVSA